MRLDGPQKLPLLHGERADRKLDRRALLQQQQSFEQRRGILAAGERHRHAIAIADHLKAMDSLADFAQKCFFEIHSFHYRDAASRGMVRRSAQVQQRRISQEVAMQASLEPSVASPETRRPPQLAQRNFAVDAYRGFVMLLMMAEVLQLSRVARAFPGNQLLGLARVSSEPRAVGRVFAARHDSTGILLPGRRRAAVFDRQPPGAKGDVRPDVRSMRSGARCC